MQRTDRASSTAGFTLIELLVILALMGILMVFGLPSLFNTIMHQKILGTAQQTAILMRSARLNAIKTGTNTVVAIDTTAGTVTAFTDLNANNVLDTATETPLARVDLPKGITFLTTSGFTSPPAQPVAVFRSNGSVLNVGAFRFQDSKGDQIQACVLASTSGRIALQKYQGGSWIAQGEGGQVWKWN